MITVESFQNQDPVLSEHWYQKVKLGWCIMQRAATVKP